MSHDKEGNRCLDVARSRYTFYLSSQSGQYRGNSTWHFTNPSMHQVDNKYSGNSVIMLRSLHVHTPASVSPFGAPGLLTVNLDGLPMRNNATSLANSKITIGGMAQSTAIGVVNLQRHLSSGGDAVGEHFRGSAAECGQLVAGDLVNSDFTVRLQGHGHGMSTPNAAGKTGTDLFFEAAGNHWVCKLEVQTLLNYNKPDSAY